MSNSLSDKPVKQITIDSIFERKRKFHREQARIPIEDKIKILIKLQEIALTIKPVCGPDDHRMVWQIERRMGSHL